MARYIDRTSVVNKIFIILFIYSKIFIIIFIYSCIYLRILGLFFLRCIGSFKFLFVICKNLTYCNALLIIFMEKAHYYYYYYCYYYYYVGLIFGVI